VTDETRDPLAGSAWSTPATVAGFVRSLPNATLLRFAADELGRVPRGVVIDIGCGAGRNAVPLAASGWRVLGTVLSWPMLTAAMTRARDEQVSARFAVALAPMQALPVRDAAADVVIAHGIWNLARSSHEFRAGVREAARIARPGAALFVFTFSRHTLADEAVPVAGEPFVFTQFSGDPQCFVSESQLIEEMAAAGFTPDPAVPLTEHNRRRPGALVPARPAPVIYEAAFRRS
jgi:ubiquinone/menaquinone biosynthesis C-methylase UbiE